MGCGPFNGDTTTLCPLFSGLVEIKKFYLREENHTTFPCAIGDKAGQSKVNGRMNRGRVVYLVMIAWVQKLKYCICKL